MAQDSQLSSVALLLHPMHIDTQKASTGMYSECALYYHKMAYWTHPIVNAPYTPTIV